MSAEGAPVNHRSSYTRLLRNRPFVLLWGGQTISTVGDAFFNLAVVWGVYSETGSAFQTSLIQVVWQLSAVLVGPIAGVLADRQDRKRLMVVGNLAAATVVSVVAIIVFLFGRVPTVGVLASILFLDRKSVV